MYEHYDNKLHGPTRTITATVMITRRQQDRDNPGGQNDSSRLSLTRGGRRTLRGGCLGKSKSGRRAGLVAWGIKVSRWTITRVADKGVKPSIAKRNQGGSNNAKRIEMLAGVTTILYFKCFVMQH